MEAVEKRISKEPSQGLLHLCNTIMIMVNMMMKIAGYSQVALALGPIVASSGAKWIYGSSLELFAEPAKSYFAMCFFTLFAKLRICCSCRNLFVWRNFWRHFFCFANICKMSLIPVFCIFWRHFALLLTLAKLRISWASKSRIWFSVSLSSCT